MKYIVNLFVIIILSYSITVASAENKVAFLDINKIMNESKSGISIKKQLEKMHKDSINSFEKTEKKLKEEENSILSQKNILDKNEYEKKISQLRETANNYRKDRENKINLLTEKRIKANKELLDLINPILVKYSKENSISLLLQKKDIIMGSSELDITNDILKLVNEQVDNIIIN